MKNTIYILLLLPLIGSGQSHLKNQKFVSAGFGGYDGISKNNLSTSFEIGQNNKKGNAQGFGFTLTHKFTDIENVNGQPLNANIPVNQYFASYFKEFNFLKNYNNTIRFSLIVQANAGYEAINKNKTNFNDYKINTNSDYLLGIGLSPEFEWNNCNLGVTNNLNFISQYQRVSLFPYLKYRFHL